MKVAFDQNVPIGIVNVLLAFSKEAQFKRISGDFDIKTAADYTPKPSDADYLRKNDMPWLKRFAADGGRVVISGDTKMRTRAHERLALIEGGFVVIFLKDYGAIGNTGRNVRCSFCGGPSSPQKLSVQARHRFIISLVRGMKMGN